MSTKKLNWFRVAFQLRQSVIPKIMPQVLASGVFGIFISLLYYLGLPVSLPILSALVPSIVLGLLLVFRTNTAYDRFWEGRKYWANLVINVRNLARQIWVVIEEQGQKDREHKVAALRLIVAFTIATKLYLREEPINIELQGLMSPSEYFVLQSRRTPPLEIAFWVSDFLQKEYRRQCVSPVQVTALQHLVDNIIDAFSNCERILQTPMPLPYAIHLKQLLLIYCLSLPFQLVKDLNWATGLVVALISFTLFGIEQIGIQIENPFARAPHNLPLDEMCNTMVINIEDLSTLATDSSFAPTEIF
jgi:ion channel-forming bestrophin family protein